MKHFMLRNLMLLSLMFSALGISSVWAQFTDLEVGGVYHFTNAKNTGYAMGVNSEAKVRGITPVDKSDFNQLWLVKDKNTDGNYILQSLGHGGYLLGKPQDTEWILVESTEASNYLVLSVGHDSQYNVIRGVNNNGGYGYANLAQEKENKILGWATNVDGTTDLGSHWTIEKVNEASLYDNESFRNTVIDALANLFSDDACTTPKKSLTADALESDTDYQALTPTLQKMAKKVYGATTWEEANYDSNKSAWGNDYAKKYRVQWYEPYTEPECAASALRINAHTNLNNPTGIFANSGDVLFVMVEGEIKEGAYLYLAKYTGHNKLGGYKNGVQLQSGLNVIPVTEDGSNYCINYVVQTFDTSKGTGKKAIIEGRELSNYPDLQIHIEGGHINGYWNKMGDNVTTHNGDFNYPADTDANWDYIKARATQTDVTVLGEYITLQFPLTDAGTGDDKGMATFFNSYKDNATSLAKTIEEWDNIMVWERLLMGIVGETTITAEDMKSPYSNKDKVFAYTGRDTNDNFGCDYSEYYRIHGLSFGTEGGYMYGSWDHCGYNFNTMESIMVGITTDAGSHWGPAHEIGHQHQGPLNMRGLTEVTNNLFSNVVLWYFGETTSRYNGDEGALSNVLAQFNAEGTDFFSNNIWAQTIMYYKLFLYYHVLGHNPKFYPRLFEMLRQNPMTIDYAQDGSACLLHFYKLCCAAAGEDLTEFFRAHGFFEVMNNRFVGDYSNAVYNMTQAQIDAAIAEVKAKNYSENIAVLFITDATGGTIQSHKGDNLELYGETTVCAELGSYATFSTVATPSYNYTISGNTVTMEGDGGVGFVIFNENDELIGFSDKKVFDLSLEAVEAILNGEARFEAVHSDATTHPATFVGDADARDQSLLGKMIESVNAFTNYEDATGKKIGYYKSSSLESIKAALEKAQEVYDKASYTAVFNALKQEYNAFLAADYNEIPMIAGTFILKSCSNTSKHLCVTDNNLGLTTTAEADLDDTAKWVFEKTGSGKYYIKNLATGKYIGELTKDNNVPVLNTTGADAYDVVPMSNPGEFAIVYNKDLSFNNSTSGVIGWGYNGDRNSWWYITAVETDPADAQAVLLKELLDKTQALYDQMAVTPIPQVIPLTESSYFSNALQKGGAYPSDNFISYSVLCDGDPFTHFHSAYSGTNPGTHHYIRVDLGEEYKSDLFAFTYTNRANNNKQNPTAITVEGSNEENGTYEGIVSLTTLDGLPTAEASSFESELLGTQGKAYRYLRFKVTATNSNEKYGDYPYFSITELGVLKGSFAITANSKYASNEITDAYMLEVFDALRQAKHGYRNATTASEYTAVYNTLNAYYETLLNAYNAVKDADLSAKKADLLALIAQMEELIDECSSPSTENAIQDISYKLITAEENYLLVDIGENNALQKFTFSYQTTESCSPYMIKVSGSNDNSEFTELATFSQDDEFNALPTIVDYRWRSSDIEAYRYLRFNVTSEKTPENSLKVDGENEVDTSNGAQLSNKFKNSVTSSNTELSNVLNGFCLTNIVEQATDIYKGDVTAEQLTQATEANAEATTVANSLSYKNVLIAEKDKLQELYDALLEASQSITVRLNSVRDEADKQLLSGIEMGQTIATFSAPHATIIPAGVTAYYAQQAALGETVSLTPVEAGKALPANQGVILVGNEGFTEVKFILAENAEEFVEEADLSANKLSNSAKGSVVMESNDYILTRGGQGIGLYQATPDSQLAQRKAFFRFTAGTNPANLVLKFGGATTGIDNVTTEVQTADDMIYDIYGRRVTEIKKGGVYIKNGKKFITK